MHLRDVRMDPPANGTVDATTTELIAEDGDRKYAILYNDSNETVYLGIGHPAVLNKGPRMNAEGGFYELLWGPGGNFSMQAINAICASGGKNVTIQIGR